MKEFMFTVLMLSVFVIISCQQTHNKGDNTQKIEFNQALADELKAMVVVDQVAAYIPQGKYVQMTSDQWQNFKDSVFTAHKLRLKEIFDEVGYPGYNMVGEEGANNFWLMVQHSDKDIGFQRRVLEKLKVEVERKNASGSNYGLLSDRVKINQGEKQIYGTQVTYSAQGQAYPKPLFDSINVNKRRAEVGLEPIELYLNEMTLMHFEMNKEYLKSKGISAPLLYKIDSGVVNFKR